MLRKISPRVILFAILSIFSVSISFPKTCPAATADMAYAVDDRIISRPLIQDIYHLRDKATCGITITRNDIIPYEGIAGFRATMENCTATITGYSHNDTYASGGDVVIRALSNKEVVLGNLKADETKTFNIGEVIKKNNLETDNGVYVLAMKLIDQDVYMNIYYDGASIKACRLGYGMANKIKAWNNLIGDLDPNTCLDVNYVGKKGNPITYPTSGQNGNCNHVDEWKQLSHKIISNDELSDEIKVYALVHYIACNYAYDDWRVTSNNNQSRATKANTWNDDNLWMYYNMVGQCWDFANVMAIMCREQGIPCTSVDNSGHTASAVWLNDEWVCIDVSALTNSHCVEYDTDPEKWNRYRVLPFSEAYGYYSTEFNTYNQGLCTKITATSRVEQNPM